MNALEHIAIYNYACTNHVLHKIKTAGFREFLRKWAAKYNSDIMEELKCGGYIPDAWYVQRNGKRMYELVAVEIEDTSTLTEGKLRWYADIDDQMVGWNLAVVVTDRYGLTSRNVPLQNYYYGFLSLDAEQRLIK